jgi:hypothetical protein
MSPAFMVQVRRFPYEDYPEHVQDVRNYAFKTLVLQVGLVLQIPSLKLHCLGSCFNAPCLPPASPCCPMPCRRL